MSDARHDRLLELLADRALVGLAPDEAAELTTLLAEFPNEDADAFDRAAAAAQLAHLEKLEPMPAQLASRIALPATGGPHVRSISPIRPNADRSRFAGWIAAAACFVVAVYAWFARPPEVKYVAVISSAAPLASSTMPPIAAKPSLADQRQKLAADPTATTLAWSATKDPAAAGASGDVVFSVAEQRGFMRFHGLAANDPKRHQYQLWIFDSTQDKRYPIDGGVFDVDATSGDVIVQIEPKIRVNDPTLFAVTIENPGGVVVSKREHLVVTAAKI